MLKAILYYILFLAEYLITIFIGGFLVGFYMAINIPSGSHSQQIEALKESVYPFIIVIGIRAYSSYGSPSDITNSPGSRLER